MGVMATPEALELAQERGFDLVEVAPMSSPPVTRLLDYGQFKYEQARKDKEARRHQRSVEFKEIRLRVKIGKGDFDTKVNRATRFLEDGDRVKVTVQFRGREVSHAYIGRDLLQRFAERVEDHGTVDRLPILEGRSMSMVLTSTHRPGEKSAKDADARAEAKQEAKADEGAKAPAAAEPAKQEAKTEKADEAEVAAAPAEKPAETKTKTTAKAERPKSEKKEAAPKKTATPAAEDGSETQTATPTGG
jgi:translation initiation factor IF-3